MGAFKAMSIWFPKERLSLLVALFLAVGGLGAISASSPLEYLLQITDWRTIYFALSLITLIYNHSLRYSVYQSLIYHLPIVFVHHL